MIGDREHPERLWASNGFDRFQPRRASRAPMLALYGLYALMLIIAFCAGLWAIVE